MTSRAIQVSITHATIGVAAGSAIEAFMPTYSASSSNAAIMFEAVVQVALNGVLVAAAGGVLGDEDPTSGLLFSLGLFEAQPGLRQRICVLSRATKQQMTQGALKMVPPAQEVS